VNSCPYHDVSDECYTRLDAMIGKMNEEHEHFASMMRECDSVHETDLSLPCLRLEARFYDDYKSSLPLDSNVVNDAALTNLGEVFDPPLTPLTFVAPSFSSTPMDTSVNDSILLASPLPLAQCTGLEMGETSRGDASLVEDVLLSWSGGLTLVEPYLEEALFEELCDDSLVVGAAPRIEHIDPIWTEPLDLTPILSPSLPTTPTHLHAVHESLGDIREYNPFLDPYCAHLEDMPRKIEWTTFFDYYFDFSMAFDKFKRALSLFVPSLLVFSYSHYFETHTKAYDKLLRTLTASELAARVLSARSD